MLVTLGLETSLKTLPPFCKLLPTPYLYLHFIGYLIGKGRILSGKDGTKLFLVKAWNENSYWYCPAFSVIGGKGWVVAPERVNEFFEVVGSFGTPCLYKCKICSKSMKLKSKIRRHILSVHGAPTNEPCPMCSRIFKNKPTLESHMRLCTQRLDIEPHEAHVDIEPHEVHVQPFPVFGEDN